MNTRHPLTAEDFADGCDLGGEPVVFAAGQETVFHHGAAVVVGAGADPDQAAADVERNTIVLSRNRTYK